MRLPDFGEFSKYLLGCATGAAVAYWLQNRQTPLEHQLYASDGDDYKLVLVVRRDLKMGKGKIGAQCGHASVAAFARATERAPKRLKKWLSAGQPKIAVQADSEAQLVQLQKEAAKLGLLTSSVRDAGRTQVQPGSRTVLAIGPGPKHLVDQVTGNLRLM